MTENLNSRNEIEEKLQILKVEHKALDSRLIELEKHVSMTTEEQIEAARIKKQKLKKKDEISRLEYLLWKLDKESDK